MSTRAAPGPQLAAGRLRVDAARAIAKLREYQLVDRTAWVLEAIRAAVASGATSISLTGDANDVWLAWEGPAWPAGDLPQLFDELVSPEPTDERHHLRLLAAAVNSALGGAPAYVDLYSCAADGTQRARYTPDVLIETDDVEDSALRRVIARPASAPAGAISETGMVVHFRRRAALGMLTYLFWEREPPELATARAACRDLAIPITIGATTFGRDREVTDLARIAFGGDLEGFVAIVDPTAPRPPHLDATLEIAERGVVLAVYPLALSPAGGSAEFEPRAPVPVRVFVDARRMPTNASRSQVRREVPPISTAEQRAPALVGKLVEQLLAEVGEPTCAPKKRHAALALLASLIAGPEWTTLTLTERLGPFTRVPLLRDATGQPRDLAHPWSGHVYTGAEPLDQELGPWVSSILWIPRGDPAAAVIAGSALDRRDTKRRLAWARRQRRAHRKFFAHAPSVPSLVPHSTSRLRLRLGARLPGGCVPASWFDNLTGELGVSFERGDGEVLVLYQGRPLERVVLPSPIGFEAVVDAIHLTPGDRYKSVARDACFTLVERALQAALICAAEAIALGLSDGTPLPDGFVDGTHTTTDVEARAVRAAMGLAHDLGLPRSTLLANAAVWPSTDGRWLELAALANERVIGTATARVPHLRGRRVVAGNAQLLAKLLPDARIVDYDQRQGVLDPERVAVTLATELGEHGVALAIESDGLRGAIAPARGTPSLQFHHLGQPLDKIPRDSPAACSIAVDSDDIVPAEGWRVAADTAGLHQRDFRDWERALLRAILLSLVGERPPELVGPTWFGLDNPAAEWACRALQISPPLLDSRDRELLAKLAAAKFLHLLGERDLFSIDQLARRFTTRILFVDRLSAPVEGFTPLVASPAAAAAIGKLAGLPVMDGHDELLRRRRIAERAARLARHRETPPRAFTYPFDGPHITAEGDAQLSFQALVGLGRSRLELEVRVEQRAFAVLTRSDELPIYAVIELGLAHVDDHLTGLADTVVVRLIDRLKQSVPSLLGKIAKDHPLQLADPGPARTLLSKWLATVSLAAFAELRATLCAAPAFATIYKTRTSLADASTPARVLQTARFDGDWLGPGDGEAVSAYETGVVKLLPDDHELARVLDRLHPGRVVDVSDEVARLQANRRMARGMLPIPTLPHVPAELKRKLGELGPLGQQLGHGELGLVAASPGVLIYDQGTLRLGLQLDVLPAVQLAIEAPELVDPSAPVAPRELAPGPTARPAPAKLTADAQHLALVLVREVIASGVELPARIKHGLRHAVLAGRIRRDLIGELAVFELADGAWVGLAELERQIAAFGQAWAVTRPTTFTPLDPERRVFVVAAAELDAAAGNFAMVDAHHELVLDEQARRNRARPPAAALELRGRDYLLAEATLDGDGETGARGVIAPLLPHAADQRGMFAHRRMVPFSLMTDPCRWPTLAMVDDARLQPDRTWDRPLTTTAAWTALTSQISALSERVLATLVPQRAGALAHLHLGPGVSLGPEVIAQRLQLRGAVWLAGPPREPHTAIEVFDVVGRHDHQPTHPLGMGGTIYVHSPNGWHRDEVLEDLVPRMYGHLVTQLLGRAKLTAKPPSDVVAAHAATAIAIGAIAAGDVGPMLFPCFRPEPLDGNGLARLFSGREPVSLLPIAELEAELIEPDATGVVEDGSELSQAVIARLGARTTRAREPKRPKPRSVTLPRVPAPPSPTPPQPAARPSAAHRLQSVADAVHARLADRVPVTFQISIADVEQPIMAHAKGLVFAGRDRRLHAIADGLRANTPWANDAIDALCAHAVTVLDDAHSEVNQQTVRDVLAVLLRD